MYCNYCGKAIQEDAHVCAYCGKCVGVHPMQKKLIRPRSERKIAGVALAFANYFEMDVSLIRVVWLLVTIFGGTGLPAYIVCWIVIPSEPQVKAEAAQTASPQTGSVVTGT